MSYEGDDGYDSGDGELEGGDQTESVSETELYDENTEADSELMETGTAEETPDETEESSGETTESEDDPEVRAEIEERSEYSQEVNDHIHSVEELEVYQRAGLHEQEVDGRKCLVRDDIDPDFVDPKTLKTNRQLMAEGRAPVDAKTGCTIELHHIGQEYDSPLAELTSDEHDDFTSVLHTKETDSWRSDEKKNNHYNNVQRPGHWKARV